VNRYAQDIADYQLADYQQAARALLKHPFISRAYPDEKTIGRIRRFSATLALDMREAFGYQLIIRGDTARLLRVKDRLDPTQPALTRTGRRFGRRQYAYLSLLTALLARAGIQTTVRDLAGLLKADANRIAGLGFDDDNHEQRRAFVDTVSWLEERGVLHTVDGSSDAWLADPDSHDALYDVDRDALFALWRSRVMLQTVGGVRELLGERVASDSESVLRERAGQAARRALVESPVAYFAEHPEPVVNFLRGRPIADDLERLTGLVFERRREGVLLVDTARLSVEAFPREGAVANAALLVLVAACDLHINPDCDTAERDLPAWHSDALERALDEAIPVETRFAADPDEAPDPTPPTEPDTTVTRPYLDDRQLHDEFIDIMQRYAKNFGRDHHAAPMRLLAEALDLLERFRLVRRVEGGIVLEPLAGRYRHTVFRKRSRDR
jgi:uncharacterized protein (TIGR02678 family)